LHFNNCNFYVSNAETDFNQIAHDQNLQEANLEGEEESRIQGNVSQQ